MKAFVVAGISTGVGKTTVTAALASALRSAGHTLQLFKCGPDYIDPAHHAALSGRPSYNLDTWMIPEAANRAIFWKATCTADVAIVEGMMGLFDGAAGDSDKGSTAEIAKLLGIPVVLVVDASNAARSVAAVVQGFRYFDPNIRLLGIILNAPAGPAHVKLLRDAIAPTGVPILGWLPKLPETELAERHLGLVTAAEKTWTPSQLDALASAARENIDLNLLLRSSHVGETNSTVSRATQPRRSTEPVRLAVARDQAFSFYYQSSLDELAAAGAQLVDVSPLRDKALPSDIDGLYLGGGYPEVFAEQLAGNRPFLDSIRTFAKGGRPIYAECGGLMYLAESLRTRDGRRHSMASLLPLSVEMLDHLEQFGYTEVEVRDDCAVGKPGARLRGHSFHYSRVIDSADVERRYTARQLLTGAIYDEGYCAGNVLGSYIHLSFAANPDAAGRFIDSCLPSRMVAQ